MYQANEPISGKMIYQSKTMPEEKPLN